MNVCKALLALAAELARRALSVRGP